MANVNFTLFDSVTVTSSSVSGAATYTVLTSDTIQNQTALQSLRLIIQYDNIDPDFGAYPQTFFIDALVESQTSNKWFPIAYQFAPFRRSSDASQRILLLQPNLSTFDSGLDDIIYTGFAVNARISRQQGKLGPSFRTKILITETNPNTSGSFKSVTISAYGEMFDV